MAAAPAVHFKLNPQLLKEDILTAFKAELAQHPGEQPVYFHITSEKEQQIIIKARAVRLSVDAEQLVALQDLDVISDVQAFDAAITDYRLLRDIFETDQRENGHAGVKLKNAYYTVIKTSSLNGVLKKILRNSSQIKGLTDGVATIAFPDENTLNLFKSDGTPGVLARELSAYFGQPVEIETEIDASLHGQFDSLNAIVAEPKPPPMESPPQSQPAPRRKKKKRRKRKKINVPSSPDEILDRTLDLFSGEMDLKHLPKEE